MQSNQTMFRQYVVAGDSLVRKERIVVSSHVYVENDGYQDTRDTFKADQKLQVHRGIPLKWAMVFLGFAVILCILVVGNKTVLTSHLQTEYAQLEERYTLARMECESLRRQYDQKSDASGVCYYAVQNLGMRLATHEETIGIQATYLPVMTDKMKGTANGNR